MISDKLTLWGVGSPRAFRIHWMLCEMGLVYDTVRYLARSPETASPEFAELSPRNKVPVFQHGDFVLTESAVILNYIADAFPVPAHFYVPKGPRERARIAEWTYFAATELDAHSLYVIRKHTQLAHLYGEAPAAVTAAWNYFLRNVEAMEGRIAAADPFILFDKLSIADIFFASCLEWATALELKLSKPAMNYLVKMRSRPAYRTASECNSVPLAR